MLLHDKILILLHRLQRKERRIPKQNDTQIIYNEVGTKFHRISGSRERDRSKIRKSC